MSSSRDKTRNLINSIDPRVRLPRRSMDFSFMETQKEASQETIDKIKSLPRIPYDTFKELIRTGEIIPSVKLKTPRTIFFDEATGMFIYMNPFHMELCKCGEFKTDEDGGR